MSEHVGPIDLDGDNLHPDYDVTRLRRAVRERDTSIAKWKNMLAVAHELHQEELARLRLSLADTIKCNAAMASERDEAKAEIARLRAVVERDRCAIADGVTQIKKAIAARDWLSEGRGSFACDDDRYQKEFGDALSEISAALTPLRQIAADWSDSPTKWEDVQAARLRAPLGVDVLERAGDLLSALLGREIQDAELHYVAAFLQQYGDERAREAITALREPTFFIRHRLRIEEPTDWWRAMIDRALAAKPGSEP